jgi:guanyl-specific ribonuclease Sa
MRTASRRMLPLLATVLAVAGGASASAQVAKTHFKQTTRIHVTGQQTTITPSAQATAFLSAHSIKVSALGKATLGTNGSLTLPITHGFVTTPRHNGVLYHDGGAEFGNGTRSICLRARPRIRPHCSDRQGRQGQADRGSRRQADPDDHRHAGDHHRHAEAERRRPRDQQPLRPSRGRCRCEHRHADQHDHLRLRTPVQRPNCTRAPAPLRSGGSLCPHSSDAHCPAVRRYFHTASGAKMTRIASDHRTASHG